MGRMGKCEDAYLLLDGEGGGGGPTANTKSASNDKKAVNKSGDYDYRTKDTPIEDDHNAWKKDSSPVNGYNHWEPEDTVADDYSSLKTDTKKSDDYDYWTDDDPIEDDHNSWNEDNSPVNDYGHWEAEDTVADDYSSLKADTAKSNHYDHWTDDDPMPDSHNSWNEDNSPVNNYRRWEREDTVADDYSYWKHHHKKSYDKDYYWENYQKFQQEDTPANDFSIPEPDNKVSENYAIPAAENTASEDYSIPETPPIAQDKAIEDPIPDSSSQNDNLKTSNNQISDSSETADSNQSKPIISAEEGLPVAVDTKVENDSPVDTLSSHIEPTATKAPVENERQVDTVINHIEPTQSQSPVENERQVDTVSNHIEINQSLSVENDSPVDTLSSHIEPTATKAPVENERQVDTVSNHIEPSIVKKTVGNIQSVNTAIDAVEAKTNNSASLQNNSEKTDDITLESAAPRNNNLNSKSADSMSVLISESTKNTNTKKEEGIPTETIDKNKEIKSAANTENGASQKNEVKIAQQQIEPVTVSPSTKARDLLLSKRGHTDNVTLGEFSHTSRRDILENYKNKPASIIVDYDTQGRSVTLDNFKVNGMDISIKREHDGYGNKFDSVRTIETVRLANGQVVKCNIQDMVGANAKSKEFADKHKGRILPDGKYFFTAAGLTKQKDGTYNSACFQNTLRLQTRDANIPEHIRNDINSKYFLFHATEYKEGYIPEDGGNRIWINPWSAGCISSITGGQATHDDFMNMLTGITPENISITITSKKHVNI